MVFFHSLPVPELREWVFFNSLPFPELWEWNDPFPFPFPISKMSFPLTPVTSHSYFVAKLALKSLSWNNRVQSTWFISKLIFKHQLPLDELATVDYATIIITNVEIASWESLLRHDLFLDIQTWIGQTGSSVIG